MKNSFFPSYWLGRTLLLLLSTAPLLSAHATDYYVSTAGNDTNTGTSASSAWRTIGKVNGFTFRPGDRLLFAGGQLFAGTMQLTATDGGSASNPVVVGSYGTGPATLDGGAGSGLTITGATGILVNNLKFVGKGRKTGNQGGKGVYLSGATNITLDQLETSGFQHAGVDFYNSTNVRLTHVYAHDNGFAGITAYGSANAYLGYCRAINNPGDPTITNNHSGNGIVLSVKKATIEYCEAADNGYDMQQTNDNGPVGIWCFDADQVTIQYCISHNNNSPKGDGGGFDLDGGVTNSVVQYNYAYENKNYGFLAWEYGSSIKWTNNVFRYNISVNNSGPGLFLGSSGGQGVSNCEVYNNLFYNTSYPAVTQYGGAVNFNFRNNIFVGPGSASLVATVSGLTYQANDYWFSSGSFNVGGYNSLTAWANATGQEKRNGVLVGLSANPQLRDPANYEKLTDPTQLATLTAFLVPASSPVVDQGLDLKSAFSLDPGAHDFYGNALPAGNGVDMGAQEVSGGSPPPTPANLVLNPGFEADGAAVQGPRAWSTWAGSAGTSANADYTESYGGARTGTFHGTHYKTSPYEVYTYQVVSGLPNGRYTLRAWTKSSGGQTYALLLAKNYGGSQLAAPAPTTPTGGVNGAWQQVSLPAIDVTNGQCEIGFYSYAGAGQWLYFDDVELVAQAATANRAAALPVQAPVTDALSVYPNPATDQLRVQLPAGSQAGQLSLVDGLGRVVRRQPLPAGTRQAEVAVRGLPAGLYLLRVRQGPQVQTQKVLVQE